MSRSIRNPHLSESGEADLWLRIKGKPDPLTGARKSEFCDYDHLEAIPEYEEATVATARYH